MTPSEWDRCDDPLRLLDAIRDRAEPVAFRRFAVACCEPIRELLDEAGRAAVAVAERLARGMASEAERAAAEQSVFRLDAWTRDMEVWYGDMPLDTAPGPEWYAAEAAGGAVASDPWAGARQAARAALAATPEESRAAVRASLCRAFRASVGRPPLG